MINPRYWSKEQYGERIAQYKEEIAQCINIRRRFGNSYDGGKAINENLLWALRWSMKIHKIAYKTRRQSE